MNGSSSTTTAQGPGWALPLFLTERWKYLAGALMFVFAAILYLASNHLHFYPPQMLPMSWIDHAVPFLPNTVWIYVSEYVFFITVYVTCRDMVNLNRYLYSFVVLQIVSCLIFWAWPTTYPRDQFPLPADLNGLTYALFSSLRNADTPANCCPSLHVSSVYLSSFIFLDDQRKKFPYFFGWGTAIAITTLTTKQHYLVDVITGLMMATLFYWAFHRWIPYRPRRGLAAPDHAKR
jgi:hypothetical protein